MLNQIENRIKKSTIFRCSQVLETGDRFKLVMATLIQILLALLDLVGVMLIGVIGSLTVAGIGEKAPGARVQNFLSVIGLDNYSLQIAVGFLGAFAATLLIAKTFLALYFTRKILYFLSRKSGELSGSLVSRLLNQSLDKVQENSLHKNMYALTNGVNVVTVQILGAVISIVSDGALLIILCTSLFLTDWLVAVMTIFLFSLVAIVLYKLMSVEARKLGVEQAVNGIKSQEKISEIIYGYRELYVRDSRDMASKSISAVRLAVSLSSAKLSFMQTISRYVLEITVVVGTAIIGAILFLNNSASYSVAVLSIFMAASSRVAPAVLRLQQSLVQLKGSYGTAAPTLDMIRELQNIQPLRSPSIEKRNFFNHEDFESKIQLAGISLKYLGKSEFALSNIDLTIEQGTFLAIVGPSGAGKTSLVDVILGVTKPTSGTVRISDMDPEAAIHTWPGAIGYVPQDVVLTNGTIRTNVTLGVSDSDISDSAIWDALRIAKLDEFVAGLPNQLDTTVGDRGSKLSGGQRQRIGIARAIFSNPKTLILDEATSALDGETESVIADSIRNLKGKVTLIVVAHRLATVRQADQVVYMESGEILSTGSFEEVRKEISNFDMQARLMGL